MPCASNSVSRRRPRVLHVVADTGSGVAAAIGDHMAAMPGFEQHLLVSRDDTCQIGDHLERMATSVIEAPPGRLAQLRCLRVTTESLQPDVVHAHSSLAGASVRLALGRRWQPRIVYTPHCYAFERTDVAWPLRRAFWLAEAALSFRGSRVAACSPLEASLARALPGPQRVTYVPNVASPSPGGAPPMPSGLRLVAAAGRVTAQKAPELFAEAARASRVTTSGSDPLRWVWIGGGDPAQEALLRAAGVEVTGWLPREEALRRLAHSQLYVHTASWEGAPMTVLEAAAAAVPVIARRTPAMEALGVEPLFRSVPELLDLITDFPDGAAAMTAARCGETLRRNHSHQAQALALETVYTERFGRDEYPVGLGPYPPGAQADPTSQSV